MEITPDSSVLAVLTAGFVIGLYHAVEADHLAAVSAIVSEKKNLFVSSIVGGLWGVGHTISLFAVGIIVIFLKVQISESVEGHLEALVGGMLVLLGLNALRKVATSEKIHAHQHTHNHETHTHLHVHKDEAEERSHHGISARSVVVGMVHGLAGSAGLMLLIVPTISSPLLAMGYILVFGIGSVGGMVVMSFLMGMPIHFTANRFDLINKGIRTLAGVFSLTLGCYIVHEKLIA